MEGLRALAAAADRLGDHAAKAEWEGHRAAILAGINSALTLQAPTEGGGDETTTVYAELIGHENSFNEDRGEVGYSPLLWGLSYENIVPAVFALTAIGEGATPTGANAHSHSSSHGGDGHITNISMVRLCQSSWL